MKQLVMVGLVGLICACSGGRDRGPPPGDPVESFGQWQKDGYTFYSVTDPDGGGLVVVQAAAAWHCKIDGTGCNNITLTACLPAPSAGAPAPPAPAPPPAPPPPGACPAVCNCMSTTDCNYYCGNSIIAGGSGHPFPSGVTPK